MAGGRSFRCPVCRAAFIGASTCRRCGTDLKGLMSILIRAWQLRRKGREDLIQGNYSQAGQVLREAVTLSADLETRRLAALAQALAAIEDRSRERAIQEKLVTAQDAVEEALRLFRPKT